MTTNQTNKHSSHGQLYKKKGKGERSMVLNIVSFLLMLCFVLMYHGFALDFVLLFQVTASMHCLISYNGKGIVCL